MNAPIKDRTVTSGGGQGRIVTTWNTSLNVVNPHATTTVAQEEELPTGRTQMSLSGIAIGV